MSNSQLENIKFKIGLSGTYWDKRPAYEILIGDESIVKDQINVESGKIQYVEFSKDIENESNFSLTIKLTNKQDSDVVKDPPTGDTFTILKDMLLNIESIEIDDIVLGELMWSKSTFTPDDSKHPVLDRCVNFGWNGSYSISFTTPFYLWLLENM